MDGRYTAIGYSAGGCITTGSNNTAIGYSAGGCITTGSHAIIIGHYDHCINKKRYVILSLLYQKPKDSIRLYQYLDNHRVDFHLYKNNSDDDWIKPSIEYYHEMLPKWLLLYSLKDNYQGWNDIFQHHLLPHYFN